MKTFRTASLGFSFLVILSAAACSGSSLDPTVVITDPVAASLQVDRPTVELGLGQTVTIQASIRGATGEPIPGAAATWSSVNAEVASVDAQGTITGQGVGQTRIAATYQALSDSVLVTVVGGGGNGGF